MLRKSLNDLVKIDFQLLNTFFELFLGPAESAQFVILSRSLFVQHNSCEVLNRLGKNVLYGHVTTSNLFPIDELI